jgi:hypothetical protein
LKERRKFFDDEPVYRETLAEMNSQIEEQLSKTLGEILAAQELSEEAFSKSVEVFSSDPEVNEAFEKLCIPEMYHFYEKYCYLESLGSILRPKMAIFKLQISFGFLETYE